jgi:hypothetical protein
MRIAAGSLAELLSGTTPLSGSAPGVARRGLTVAGAVGAQCMEGTYGWMIPRRAACATGRAYLSNSGLGGAGAEDWR